MAFEYNKKYATKDTYMEYSGINLDFEIKKSQYDNPTKAVDIFIKQVTEWLYEHLKQRYEITLWDDNIFKKAIHYQIDYLRRNGDLSVLATNNNKVLAPNAKDLLHANGMANLRSQGRRYYRSWR